MFRKIFGPAGIFIFRRNAHKYFVEHVVYSYSGKTLTNILLTTWHIHIRERSQIFCSPTTGIDKLRRNAPKSYYYHTWSAAGLSQMTSAACLSALLALCSPSAAITCTAGSLGTYQSNSTLIVMYSTNYQHICRNAVVHYLSPPASGHIC
jgi:hypothetical protein